MNKNVKGVIVAIVVLGVGYAAYKIFLKKKTVPAQPPVSKTGMVSFIIQNNYSGGTPPELMAFGDDFITAWYAAAKAMQSTFSYNGRSYNTSGGKAVQSSAPASIAAPSPGKGSTYTDPLTGFPVDTTNPDPEATGTVIMF